MGYGLIREFADVLGRWWREKNNEVNRKHVMPGACLHTISNATGNHELFSCRFRSEEH